MPIGPEQLFKMQHHFYFFTLSYIFCRYNPGQTYADFIFLTGTNGFATGILSPFFGALAREAIWKKTTF
jgi:hypothetical protein